MKAVIQRVLNANLKVDGELVSEIGQGYVVFLG
ncbi:MAG: D-aminoacyl-tRNA deacylase, partial [Clostridia bacterium]|nr:D-aminoacyl-tRNA deacylase [Clostridia bacterium]